MRRLAVLAGLALAVVPGCIAGAPDECDGPDDPMCSAAVENLRISGSYVPDPASLRAGSAIIHYDDVPAWDGGAHCSGNLTPGARQLSTYIRAHFTGVHTIGGYSCRPNTANTAKMSVHGSGRALDIMIPLDHGDADNGVGDPIANWLIAHSREIGIQYLAWDRTQWSGSRSSGRVRPYTGPIPHIDHIHAELTIAASRMETPFFGGSVSPPSSPPPATPTPTPTLEARFVDQGVSAEADPTGAAQFTACAGAPVEFWFEVENTGTASWVDASDSAAGHVGRAVRLGVPSDTADPLSGRSRVSLTASSNASVVPSGGVCTTSGCRRTRFTMTGHVPSEVGIHRTTWRLVDETRAWFGPEMWLSFHVVSCALPPPPPTVDADGDGAAADVDCDDHDAARHPGASEVCSDGIDQDCDGVDSACLTPVIPLDEPAADDPGFDWSQGEPVYTPPSGSRILTNSCSAVPGAGGGGSIVAMMFALAVAARRRRR
jgi:hypothetical protein